MAFQVEDFDYPVPGDAIMKELCHHVRLGMHRSAFVRRFYGFNQLPYARAHASTFRHRAHLSEVCLNRLGLFRSLPANIRLNSILLW